MKRGLLKGLTALVISLSPIVPVYARETRQKYQTITINRRKYHIMQNKVILDEKQNRVTNQRILGNVIETYILSQELTKYKERAEKNLKNFNNSRTSTQLKELVNSYATILRNLNSSSPIPRKLNIAKNLLNGTIEAFTNIYLNPKMYLYAEITSDLKRAQRDYKNFIRTVDRVDLNNHRNARTLYQLLLRSEPIIKAATESFKEIKDSNNSQLKIQKIDQEKFMELLKQKETEKNKRILQRKRQLICNRVRARAKSTKEARNYKQIKDDTKRELEKILKNISLRFYFNTSQYSRR